MDTNSLYDRCNVYQSVPGRANQGPVVGLQALYAACLRLYPNQPNPLQVTARVKYWLGGPDPLDYISMYWNPGCERLDVPPHWHYVSFGLSDLHGDGRVHPPPIVPLQSDQISGLGLELTFRLVAEKSNDPPTWPAALLQRLAKYIFNTGNRLCAGDHVSWHSALDGSDECATSNNKSNKSKIRHMLIASDPQLSTVETPLGKVQFVQIVGVTNKELRTAQQYGGASVLEALSADRCTPWLITDIRRSQSVTINVDVHSPSDLSGVAANCHWEYWDPKLEIEPTEFEKSPELPQNVKDEIKSVLKKGLQEIAIENHSINECKMSTDSVKFALMDDCFKNKKDFVQTKSFEMSKMGAALLDLERESNKQNDSKSERYSKDFFSDVVTPSVCKKCEGENCDNCSVDDLWMRGAIAFRGVHLIFDREAGSFLSLALRRRILHGRHFTWKAVSEVQAITLVAEGVSGAIVTKEKPIAANNGWLQILVPDDFASKIADELDSSLKLDDKQSDDDDDEDNKYPTADSPTVHTWHRRGLKITVYDNRAK